MRMRNSLAAALVATVLAASPGLVRAAPPLPPGFTEGTVATNGTALHYVRGGRGPAIVLLHGYPQSWYEWRRIMPRLAERHTVVAVDLRGIGGSAAATGGFDKATMAADVRGLVQALDLGKITLVGHDIGGMVAYAYTRQWPETLTRLAIVEAPLPGVGPWDRIKSDPRTWHFAFHQQPGLAEQLVEGRQRQYFRPFYDVRSGNPAAISDEDVAVFAEAYGTPAALKAGFEFYRAFPTDEAFGKARTGPIDVPVLYMGGEFMAGPFVGAIGDALKAGGFSSVRTHVIAGSGHWAPEEKPDELVRMLLDFTAGG